MKKVIVVGAGAAGMMAAFSAAEEGCEVTLLEKNEKPGKKIYITGKGRGNLTNASDISDFFDRIISNPKFLYSALYTFDNTALVSFMESRHIRLKTERGGRMFPASDHASDITKALSEAVSGTGVNMRLNSEVKSINTQGSSVTGVTLASGERLSADLTIIATGGCSYPYTGSTGDGFRFARSLGIKVREPRPALVPLITGDDDLHSLAGLSLKNVSLTVFGGKRKLSEDFGEMLFTHSGISGPLGLRASSRVAGRFANNEELSCYIDMKTALTADQLDARFLRVIEGNPKKTFRHFFDGMVPGKLRQVLVDRSGISPEKKFCEITKDERKEIARLLKAFSFSVTGSGGFSEAIITQGGVCVDELDPGSMRSKRMEGLAFAGEVIDVDALTGGYNMQIAFSTGYLAGKGVRDV